MTFTPMVGTRRMIPTMVGIAMFSFSVLQPRAQTVTESKAAVQPIGTITGRIVSQSGDKLSGGVAWASPIGIIAQPRSTSVDSNGNFKLEGLDAGVYSVFCNVPGFVSAPPASPDEPRRYYHTGDSATLTLIKGGVITGTVTSATNTPVVAAAVRAYRVRDANGQPDPGVLQPRERTTDDRGVYRFYGLPPGTYVVSVGGAGRYYGGIGASPYDASPYDSDAPTYAPSATRDTAMEIVVGSGEEITADIQYRGDPGQAISGTLAGLTQTSSQPRTATGTVTLTDIRSRTLLISVPSSSLTNYTFAFYGVSDGEYEVVAQQYLQSRETLMSAPRRIRVQGADVTGINLSLVPLASISVRLVLESNPQADCVKGRATALQETIISARRLKQETKPATGKTAKSEPAAEIPLAAANQAVDGVPDAKGDFTLRNLQPGSYRIDSQLPSAGWYLRSITMGPQSKASRATEPNIPRDGINLKSGERASGLTVTITEGAAALRGRISVAEGQAVPPGLRAYLVPVEREAADNVLRYFDTTAESDAGFAIGNIAPGRYWIIARSADGGDPAKVKPIRQDSALRAKVLREAEASKKEIQFKPCERTTDYDLPYSLAPLPRQ
jgi:hypothetical protein